MTTKIDIQTKIAVAVEVLNTDKTKSEISREFGISTRSVGRYAEQFQEEAKKVLLDQAQSQEEPEEKIKASVKEVQEKIISNFLKNKQEDLEPEERKGKRGRPAKGVKSIRQTVMEVIDFYYQRGLLTKENREKIIVDIMEETGHSRQVSAKYFSGYKKLFGGYSN